mmetsp:Transcript_61053/g.120928  ORF Transcript_61053/g.120928 Transcript_61053/m.120928 type:complete len:98 (+) Transcript_61053:334-627(+)
MPGTRLGIALRGGLLGIALDTGSDCLEVDGSRISGDGAGTLQFADGEEQEIVDCCVCGDRLSCVRNLCNSAGPGLGIRGEPPFAPKRRAGAATEADP